MNADFTKAFTRIRDELKARITHKLRAASLVMTEEEVDKVQNVIIWMTIDPALQEMLLVTALDPATWERFKPDLPRIKQVFREELEFSRTELARLREETIQGRLHDIAPSEEQLRQRQQWRHDAQEG
ncbi:MAG TPA: hypothetical protein VNP04_09675 [Alphaproteobacteria bacterium]|nr:hypothetical protein [Alphaproteobacteria bacterium]